VIEKHFPEKRKYSRLTLKEKAKLYLHGLGNTRHNPQSKVALAVYLLNLSVGGACFSYEGLSCVLSLKENDCINLEIPLPEQPLVLNSKIVWLEKTFSGIRVGVVFERIKEDEKRQLLEFLQEQVRFSAR